MRTKTPVMLLQESMRHIVKEPLLVYFTALFLLTGAMSAADTNTQNEAPVNPPSPNGTWYDQVLYSHQHDNGYHWPDKTNGLFLMLSWFLGPETEVSCDVLANGQTANAFDGPVMGSGRGGQH